MNSDLPELPTVEEDNIVDKEIAKKDDKAPETPAQPKQGKAWFTLFIAWMALLFTAVGIAAGYKNWLRIHDKAKENKANIELMQQKVADVPSNEQLSTIREELLQQTTSIQQQSNSTLIQTRKFAQQSQQYAETVAAQMAEITQIQAKVQRTAKPSTSKEWLLSETEFLIRMASRKLHLDQDAHSAIAALQAADKNLARLASPHYLPVRQQLNKDIQALKDYPAPKIEEISQKISALMIQLEPLPANAQEISSGKKMPLDTSAIQVDSTEVSTANSLWAELKTQAYDQFNQAIIVRKHNQPIHSDLDADTRLQLYQLIQLRLENLRLLALRGFDPAYHQQIQLITATIAQYYPQERAAKLLATIKQWDSYNLAPKKPDILSSIKQLESALLTETVSSEKVKK